MYAIKFLLNRPMIQAIWANSRMKGIICVLAVVPFQAIAGSLLGDYTCQQWVSTELPAKKAWVDSFLAPLSLAFKSIQSEKRDLYNEDSRASGKAVTFVDAYCSLHPEKVAADGAGTYFKLMMSQ